MGLLAVQMMTIDSVIAEVNPYIFYIAYILRY